MTTIYGHLEWFHEQGMEGNALPIMLDGSKFYVNKFGRATGEKNGYGAFVNLEDGMHLTIYTSRFLHDSDVERMEDGNWQPPRYFDGILDLHHTMVGEQFPVQVIHDYRFGPDVEHVWYQRKAILYRGYETSMDWVDDQPATPGAGTTHYNKTNPVHTFHTSMEEFNEARAAVEAAWDEIISTSPIDKMITEEGRKKREANPLHNMVMRPAWLTWRWMFEQGLCAKLET